MIGSLPPVSPLYHLPHTLWADLTVLCSQPANPSSIPVAQDLSGCFLSQLPQGTKVISITIVFWFSSKLMFRHWLALSRYGSSRDSNLHDTTHEPPHVSDRIPATLQCLSTINLVQVKHSFLSWVTRLRITMICLFLEG